MATGSLERPVVDCPEDELFARNVRNFRLRSRPARDESCPRKSGRGHSYAQRAGLVLLSKAAMVAWSPASGRSKSGH
jgi:hypothetical protein